jgi:hypothetical protein
MQLEITSVACTIEFAPHRFQRAVCGNLPPQAVLGFPVTTLLRPRIQVTSVEDYDGILGGRVQGWRIGDRCCRIVRRYQGRAGVE